MPEKKIEYTSLFFEKDVRVVCKHCHQPLNITKTEDLTHHAEITIDESCLCDLPPLQWNEIKLAGLVQKIKKLCRENTQPADWPNSHQMVIDDAITDDLKELIREYTDAGVINTPKET